MIALKEELLKACRQFVEGKEDIILKTIKSNQEALYSETKSSAGDKHETGRSMLQLEMEKAGQQLEVVHAMKNVLQRIDLSSKSAKAKLGSLIITDNNSYFLSVSAGELHVNNEKYYAVSTSSPMGKLLLGKQVGESLTFRESMNIINIY